MTTIKRRTSGRKTRMKKKRIINDLRLEVFPSSASWQVVFIENGGGQSILQDFKRLPNGELSHQNLFEAIYKLFIGVDRKGDQT